MIQESENDKVDGIKDDSTSKVMHFENSS